MLTILRKVSVSGGTVLRASNNLGDVASAETSWNNLAGGNRTITGNLTVSGGTAEITTASGTAKANIYATSTTDIAQLDLKTGNGTTSGRTSRVLFRTDETSPQRWDAGMGGTKQWIVADSTNARNNIVISDTTGGVAVLGTNTNDNAATGYVGEYVSAELTRPSAISLTTSTAANVTSISLSAGDWDVTGLIGFKPSATTTQTRFIATIHTTSATVPDINTWRRTDVPLFGATDSGALDRLVNTPCVRLSLSGTTTVYLIAYGEFGASTLEAFGSIRARRVR